MQNWWYAKAGERRGPVPSEKLRELAASGELLGTDLVWTAGMPQWQPYSVINQPRPAAPTPVRPATPRPASPVSPVIAAPPPKPAAPPVATPAPVKPLAHPTPPAQSASPVVEKRAAAAPAAEPARAPVYVDQTENASAVGEMPERAKDHLDGHTAPTGNTDRWPLSDQLVSQLDEAANLRGRIRNAAGFYRLMFVLSLFSTGAFVAGAGIFLSGHSPIRNEIISYSCGFAVLLFLTILYLACLHYTLRSRRWPMLAMVIFSFLLILAGAGASAIHISRFGMSDSGIVLLAAAVLLIYSVTSLILSLRGWRAVPLYLAQPAWCQEAIIVIEG